jgi:hypothetical protein
MTDEDFMVVGDHFAQLVTRLDPKTLTLYNASKHVRVETAFHGRQFVIYQMDGRDPKVLDRVTVNDFECTDEFGASCEMTSMVTQTTQIVGYTPVQMFGHPVFVSLPLHAKLRWAAPASDIDAGSLAFPMVIRTMSRLHMRERGVTYFEAGPAFGQEFDPKHSR